MAKSAFVVPVNYRIYSRPRSWFLKKIIWMKFWFKAEGWCLNWKRLKNISLVGKTTFLIRLPHHCAKISLIHFIFCLFGTKGSGLYDNTLNRNVVRRENPYSWYLQLMPIMVNNGITCGNYYKRFWFFLFGKE